MARLAQINPLDLTGLPPIDGTPTTSHRVVRQMFEGWNTIKGNFDLIWIMMRTHEERAKGDQTGVRAHLQEYIDYINHVGAKARLLSTKIGRNPRAEADGDATLWETLGELNHEFQII
jgi:hypothetical protein